MPVDFVGERRCPECGGTSDDAWLPFCGEACWRVFDEAMAEVGTLRVAHPIEGELSVSHMKIAEMSVDRLKSGTLGRE